MNARLLTILLLIIPAAWGYGDAMRINSAANMSTGPALHLDYGSQSSLSNPVDCFMYFVPLTSLTSLAVTTEPGTTFSADITSWETKQQGNTIRVQCDFQITGNGVYCASYCPQEMIQGQLANKPNAKEVTKLLEWIRLDGPCLGRIEGIGKIINDNIQMESIEVSFNRNDSRSPVEVSIYDVPLKAGEFLFENRKNCLVARVNSLKFKQEENGTPRMSVEIASLKKQKGKEGIFSRLTAIIANAFLTSTPIAETGNEALMDFGTALYKKQPVFKFPYASNVKTGQLSRL